MTRLHDENIAAIERLVSMDHWNEHNAGAAQLLLAMALAELRALRLTDDDREALKEVLSVVMPSDFGMPGMVSGRALAVLARLTGAKP